MVPYVLLFAFVSLGLVVSRLLAVEAYFYLSAAGLAAFSGLRMGVGRDYESYAENFNAIRSGSNLTDFEPLNMAIIKLVQLVGGGNELIFLIYALITMAGVAQFVRRASPSKELSLFVFMTVSIFYLATFNVVRQWAALSMMLFALCNLADRRYLRMATFVLLACLFHLSAVVLVVVPLMTTRFSVRWVLVVGAVSGLLAEVLRLVIERLPFVHYLNEAFQTDWVGSLVLFGLYVGFLLLALLHFGYFNPARQLDRFQLIVLNMCLLSVFVLVMGYLIGLDFLATMRANIFFTIQLVVLIPWMLTTLDRATRALAGVLVVVALSGIFWKTLLVSGTEYSLTPYESSLEAR